MRYSDLLDRMKDGNTEAFLEMTDQYGWAVYAAIRQKYSDPVIADKIYNETMNAVYHGLQETSADDPLEALLCVFADRISADDLRFADSFSERENAPPEIQLFTRTLSSNGTVRKKKGFWQHMGVFLLLLLVTMLIWYMIGLLMSMGYIPYFDLGYSWLHAHIMQLF